MLDTDNTIYAQMVQERGYDPLQFPVRSHQQFMKDRNQQGWLGYTLLKVERGWQQFSASRVRRLTAVDPLT